MVDIRESQGLSGGLVTGHLVFAGLQVAILTIACTFAGVFDSEVARNQFFGHLGPMALFVVCGVAGLTVGRQSATLIRWEALAGILAAAVYVLADTFLAHPPLGIFDGAGHAEQQHVGLMLAIGAAGAFALVLLQRFGVRTGLHIAISAALFSMVILSHEQHNMAGMMAHLATAVFLGLAAVLRLLERMMEYGVLMILAGYAFFSGQMGLTMFATASRIDAAAWACYAAALGLLVAVIYLGMARPRTVA